MFKKLHSIDGAVFDIAMNLPQVDSEQTLVPFVNTIEKSNDFAVIDFSENNDLSEELLAISITKTSCCNYKISNNCTNRS